MNLAHWIFSTRIALEAVSRNPVRAGLTSLGVLFGVASVIAMLAIGRGAEQEILAQMRLLGSNNIMITAVLEQFDQAGAAGKKAAPDTPKRTSPGLTVEDMRSIEGTVPEVETASGEVLQETTLFREGRQQPGKLIGVDGDYFKMMNLSFAAGREFAPLQSEQRSPVVVIGHGVQARFFPGEDPIGKQIKAGNTWLTVVGIVSPRYVSQQVSKKLGIRDPNMDVYVPVSTMLLRVRDRTKPIPEDPNKTGGFSIGPDGNVWGLGSFNPGAIIQETQAREKETAEQRRERLNYHQLDRIIVRARSPDAMLGVTEVVRRQLARRHNGVVDFEVTVPELLLKQEQRARKIFNVVLGAIASISLVVGGIGIMNIMLASVLERIREIGVRRAVGARRGDVLSQFLAEAVLISLTGGIAGIVLGVGTSVGIDRFADIRTSVSLASVMLAFGVSITVGLVFGIVPAWRAAEQDPVDSLRHE